MTPREALQELASQGIDPQEIIKHLDAEGYDTSPLKTGQQNSLEWEGQGLQDVSATPITQPDLDKAGESIATSQFGQNHPYAGAALGTAVSKAPDIIAAVQGIASLPSVSGGAESFAGKVLGGPSRVDAGAAMGEAEKAAGVDSLRVPTLKDAATNIGAWRANSAQYLNALKERLDSGLPMNAQDLSLHHKELTDLLSQEPGTIMKALGASSKMGTNGAATAANLDSRIVDQLNTAVPGRGAAATDYAAAKLREKIYAGMATLAAAGLGRNALLSAFNKITGGK